MVFQLKGHESEFTCDVWEFKQNSFSDHVSVGAIYNTVKLPRLHFYIATQPNPQSSEDPSTTDSEEKGDDLSFEGQNEVLEVCLTQFPQITQPLQITQLTQISQWSQRSVFFYQR